MSNELCLLLPIQDDHIDAYGALKARMAPAAYASFSQGTAPSRRPPVTRRLSNTSAAVQSSMRKLASFLTIGAHHSVQNGVHHRVHHSAAGGGSGRSGAAAAAAICLKADLHTSLWVNAASTMPHQAHVLPSNLTRLQIENDRLKYAPASLCTCKSR